VDTFRKAAQALPASFEHVCFKIPSSDPLQVKLDVYLAELTKIGKSQKYTLSVDVEGGRLVVMKKVKDSQEDWTTFTHDKSENVRDAVQHYSII